MRINRTFFLSEIRTVILFTLFVCSGVACTKVGTANPVPLNPPAAMDTPAIVEPAVSGSFLAPAVPDRLRVNLDAYPLVLDPQKAVLPKEIAFLDLMYEGLTRLDENLAAVPAAADSWQYNQDATELVFTLRRDLLYSDGSPLNAMRFQAALQRLVDPVTASEFAWMVDEIRGAGEWRRADVKSSGYSKEHFISQLGIQALDGAGVPCNSYTQEDCLVLKLSFSKPAPYFHYIMGLWITFPARLELIEEGDTNWWLRAVSRTGNGPFILANLEPFVKARFTPNQLYAGIVPQSTIEFYFISDPEAAFGAYRDNSLEIFATGMLNSTINLSSEEAQELDSQSIATPGACSGMVLFGMKPISEGVPSPFIDYKVRQAFTLAFNNQDWISNVGGGEWSYGGTYIPWGFPGYEGVTQPFTFNPELAKQVLSESTYGSAQALNDLGLSLVYEDTSQNQLRYAWLVNNYRTHLGVELTLDSRSRGEYAMLESDPSFTPLLSYQAWCALYPDPQAWLGEYWNEDSPFYPDMGYANPGLKALLDLANNTTLPEERLRLFTQAHQLLLDDVPAIFGMASANRFLVKPWVKWVNSPFDSVWPGSLFPERIIVQP